MPETDEVLYNVPTFLEFETGEESTYLPNMFHVVSIETTKGADPGSVVVRFVMVNGPSHTRIMTDAMWRDLYRFLSPASFPFTKKKTWKVSPYN